MNNCPKCGGKDIWPTRIEDEYGCTEFHCRTCGHHYLGDAMTGKVLMEKEDEYPSATMGV